MARLRKLAAMAVATATLFAVAACDSDVTEPRIAGDHAFETQYTATSTNHVPVGTTVAYSSNPPCIGQHYPTPAPGGVYTSPLRPEYWVHDLEHGAIVFLYDCSTGCTTQREDLEAVARARPNDARGRFCWLLTPYYGMPQRVAVVAWGWVYTADTVNPVEINAFIDAHYRHAPEDIPIVMPP